MYLLNPVDCVVSSAWDLAAPPVDVLSLSCPDMAPYGGLAIPPLVLLLTPTGAGPATGG